MSSAENGDIIDSGRPSSITSADKTITLSNEDSEEDDNSSKSFKDGYEVVSNELSAFQDSDEESMAARNVAMNEHIDHATSSLAFKLENAEEKKSFNEIIAPNAVKEKIPFFESLGQNLHPKADKQSEKNDETNLKSIDENIDSLEFDNIETLNLSLSESTDNLENLL